MQGLCLFAWENVNHLLIADEKREGRKRVGEKRETVT